MPVPETGDPPLHVAGSTSTRQIPYGIWNPCGYQKDTTCVPVSSDVLNETATISRRQSRVE
jgi:hypothetical protein